MRIRASATLFQLITFQIAFAPITVVWASLLLINLLNFLPISNDYCNKHFPFELSMNAHR